MYKDALCKYIIQYNLNNKFKLENIRKHNKIVRYKEKTQNIEKLVIVFQRLRLKKRIILLQM